MNKKIPSPRDFMRERRPERFSDSLPIEHSDLENSVLEYHLDTITSRNQEMDFERFALAIAERIICPNLLPHSGPMGGGDSKVDTETYPVSDQISRGWYYGIGREAAKERWAFAISAADDWRRKMRDDVAGIMETKRSYEKIFFITNQFVKDKTRAEVEDELEHSYGVDIRILDRSWLVSAVIEKGNEAIAVANLGVSSTLDKVVRKGPKDVEREQLLESIEKRIQDALSGDGPGIRVVDDALEAAILARSLDRNRVEIDGRFDRATELAMSYGTRHQLINAKYQWAWATFWWLEDMVRFEKLYSEVEELVLGSDIVHHLELLTNLWMCLNTAISSDTLQMEDSLLLQRTKKLLATLDQLSDDQDITGSVIYARTLGLQIRMLADQLTIPDAFNELQNLVEQADGLANFPFTSIAQIITELGDFFGDVDGYNALFNLVVEISSRREGELVAAKLLLKRGVQHLKVEEYYPAIAILGTALTKLFKDESRDELVRALYFIAYAYSNVGLLWAARGALINATSLASHLTWTHGEVSRLQTECCNRIKWLEMELGRVPQAIEWQKVETAFRSLSAEPDDNGLAEEETLIFDGSLGILFLRSDLTDLRMLELLPDALERLDLQASALALIFALGYEEIVSDQWDEIDSETGFDEGVFRTWRDQPLAAQLPVDFSFGFESELTFNSTILGCQIQLTCENISPGIELAESVLAAMESFFSTGIVTQLVAHEPDLKVSINRSEYAKFPFSFHMITEEGVPELIIIYRDFSPHTLSHAEQGIAREQLSNILKNVFANIFHSKDFEQTALSFFRDERALERSVGFSGSFVTLGNVLGHNPKTIISDWISEGDKVFPLKREKPWDYEDRVQAEQLHSNLSEGPEEFIPAPGGEPPSELIDRLALAKHNEVQTVSLIRMPLWSKARWVGAVFEFWGEDSVPPVLGLMFESGRYATSIFELWRQVLGDHDVDERLYISIVRGISVQNPSMYRILIGANLVTAMDRSVAKFFYTMYRIQTMEPQSPDNLNNFLGRYSEVGSYLLAPAVFLDTQGGPRIGYHLGIRKKDLHVKAAWEVGRHQPEASAIFAEDDPFIPEDEPNAPVIELLKLRRSNLSPDKSSD